MDRPLLKILIAVSVALNIAFIATAGYHFVTKKCFSCRGEPDKQRTKLMKRYLKLSDEQSEKISGKMDSFRRSADTKRQQLRAKRKKMFELADEKGSYGSDIEKLLKEVTAMQFEMEKMAMKHVMSISEELTPVQRGKFKRLMSRKMKKRGYLQGPKGEGPDGPGLGPGPEKGSRPK